MEGPVPPATDAATARKKSLRRAVREARRIRSASADRAAEGAAIAAGVVHAWRTLAEQAALSAPMHAAPAGPVDEGGLDARAGGRLPAYGVGVGVVAIYRSLPTEPPTEPLAAALHDLGIEVIVPELLPDLDLDWRPLHRDGSHGDPLGVGAMGTAALVVVPALGVDPLGVRLGQGGGSYDRALARRKPGARVLAVVNDEEYVEGPLPAEPHDILVDAVVTPGGGVRWLGRALRT